MTHCQRPRGCATPASLFLQKILLEEEGRFETSWESRCIVVAWFCTWSVLRAQFRGLFGYKLEFMDGFSGSTLATTVVRFVNYRRWNTVFDLWRALLYPLSIFCHDFFSLSDDCQLTRSLKNSCKWGKGILKKILAPPDVSYFSNVILTINQDLENFTNEHR